MCLLGVSTFQLPITAWQPLKSSFLVGFYFLSLFSKLSKEAEIRYVYLVWVLDVPLGGLDLSAPYHLLRVPKRELKLGMYILLGS